MIGEIHVTRPIPCIYMKRTVLTFAEWSTEQSVLFPLHTTHRTLSKTILKPQLVLPTEKGAIKAIISVPIDCNCIECYLKCQVQCKKLTASDILVVSASRDCRIFLPNLKLEISCLQIRINNQTFEKFHYRKEWHCVPTYCV